MSEGIPKLTTFYACLKLCNGDPSQSCTLRWKEVIPLSEPTFLHLEPSSGRHEGLRRKGAPRTPASQRVLAELNASVVFDFHFIQDTDQGKEEWSGKRRDLLKAAVPSLCHSWACLPSTAFPAYCSALLCAAAEGWSWGRQKPQLLLELSSFQLL